jgi:hypothetical protein
MIYDIMCGQPSERLNYCGTPLELTDLTLPATPKNGLSTSPPAPPVFS